MLLPLATCSPRSTTPGPGSTKSLKSIVPATVLLAIEICPPTACAPVVDAPETLMAKLPDGSTVADCGYATPLATARLSVSIISTEPLEVVNPSNVYGVVFPAGVKENEIRPRDVSSGVRGRKSLIERNLHPAIVDVHHAGARAGASIRGENTSCRIAAVARYAADSERIVTFIKNIRNAKRTIVRARPAKDVARKKAVTIVSRSLSRACCPPRRRRK